MGSGSEREVIVVGAGPAGATAATVLALQGHDVLLLDRQEFPRDKACGDGVPTGAIKLLKDLGMGDKIKAAAARGEFYPLNQMRLVSPKGKVLVAEFDKDPDGAKSYVAPRVHFDAAIQQHAVDSGAEFCRADVKEPVIENGRVVGVNARVNGHVETIRSRVVIGADGVTSAITRSLRPSQGQHKDRHRAVALRAYIEDLEEHPHEVEFYLYNEILPGYAWIFPTGEGTANIGLGMRLDYFRDKNKNLKRLLKQFLEMPSIKKRLKNGGELRNIATWQLNFGSQKALQHVYNGAILIGDAAGFINPLTGGGIHNSLVSAKIASETIDRALRRGDTSRESMKVYEERCHNEMWSGMRRSYFIQRWLLRFPFLVDFLVGGLRENSMLARTFLTKL